MSLKKSQKNCAELARLSQYSQGLQRHGLHQVRVQKPFRCFRLHHGFPSGVSAGSMPQLCHENSLRCSGEFIRVRFPASLEMDCSFGRATDKYSVLSGFDSHSTYLNRVCM